jgi:hypothetical protein
VNRWDLREYLRRRREFIAERSHRHPMASAAALIFTGTWLAGWLFSTLLLRHGMLSMPLRYGLAFALSYPVFFGCVRIWCGFVWRDRGARDGSGWDWPTADEGCLPALAILIASFTLAGAFWALGGFPLLLEVAFEVAFAGSVVSRLSQVEVVGHWAHRLHANTWAHALGALVLLVLVAAALQRAAPAEHTFADALQSLMRPS